MRRRSALGKRGPVLEGRCLPLRQRGAAPGHGFRPADPAQGRERHREEQRAEGHGGRRRKRRHQRPAERGRADLRGGPAALQCAVALDELIVPHHPHEGRLVRHVEEDGQRPDGERDHEQGGQAERPEQSGHGRQAEDHGPGRVGEHHHRAGPPPVHPRARREREQQDGGLGHGEEQAQPARARVERQDGEERQGDERRVLAQLGRRLPGPETAEVGVPPQARRRGATGAGTTGGGRPAGRGSGEIAGGRRGGSGMHGEPRESPNANRCPGARKRTGAPEGKGSLCRDIEIEGSTR